MPSWFKSIHHASDRSFVFTIKSGPAIMVFSAVNILSPWSKIVASPQMGCRWFENNLGPAFFYPQNSPGVFRRTFFVHLLANITESLDPFTELRITDGVGSQTAAFNLTVIFNFNVTPTRSLHLLPLAGRDSVFSTGGRKVFEISSFLLKSQACNFWKLFVSFELWPFEFVGDIGRADDFTILTKSWADTDPGCWAF